MFKYAPTRIKDKLLNYITRDDFAYMTHMFFWADDISQCKRVMELLTKAISCNVVPVQLVIVMVIVYHSFLISGASIITFYQRGCVVVEQPLYLRLCLTFLKDLSIAVLRAPSSLLIFLLQFRSGQIDKHPKRRPLSDVQG